MEELSLLKGYLQQSIKNNGNQPLTIQHLINIIGVMEREQERNDHQDDIIEGYYNNLD